MSFAGEALPDEAGEAPVSQDFATCLTGRAIGDFVGLVGPPAEVVAAAGTGAAGTPVDDEAVAQLGGQAAGALAFADQGRLEDLVHGREQTLSLLGRQRDQGGVRRELGSVEDVVGVAA